MIECHQEDCLYHQITEAVCYEPICYETESEYPGVHNVTPTHWYICSCCGNRSRVDNDLLLDPYHKPDCKQKYLPETAA